MASWEHAGLYRFNYGDGEPIYVQRLTKPAFNDELYVWSDDVNVKFVPLDQATRYTMLQMFYFSAFAGAEWVEAGQRYTLGNEGVTCQVKGESQMQTETRMITMKIMEGRNVIEQWDVSVGMPVTSTPWERKARIYEMCAAKLKLETIDARKMAKAQSADEKLKSAKLAEIEVTLGKLGVPPNAIRRTLKKLAGLSIGSPEWSTFTNMPTTRKDDPQS
jgi:hypothetical protein